MTRNNDALARHQRRAVRLPIDLGKRPERQVVKRRELLQRIARTGDHRHAAIPQLDCGIGRNDIAKRRRPAFGLRRRRRELHNHGNQLLVDGVHLVDIDVRDFLVLGEIEACVVALITLPLAARRRRQTLSERKILMKRSTLSGTLGWRELDRW